MGKNMGILLPFHVNTNNFDLDIVGINYIEGDFTESDFIAGRNVVMVIRVTDLNSQTSCRKVTGFCL